MNKKFSLNFPSKFKKSNVTFLPSIFTPAKFQTITLSEALESISDGTFEIEINNLRAPLDEAAYKEQKKKLPAFCFNGTFIDSVTNDNFLESSGLFHFDIDRLQAETIEDDKARIKLIPSVAFCFVSPSGKGLKGALRIAPELIKNDTDCKLLFPYVQEMLAQIGYELDKSCKDVRRLCFVSHDPNIFINWNAKEYFVDLQEIRLPLAIEDITHSSTRTSTTIDLAKESKLVEHCYNDLSNSKPGNRHADRLRVGYFAGGLIAGGLVDSQKMTNALLQASDCISDGGITSDSERKTLLDAIEHGKDKPIWDDRVVSDSSKYDDIIDSTIAQLSVDNNAWNNDEFKEALLFKYRCDQPAYQQIIQQLKKWNLSREVNKEIRRLYKVQKAKKLTQYEIPINGAYIPIMGREIRRGELVNTDIETGNRSRKVESEAAVIIAECLYGKVAFCSQAQMWHKFTETHWQPLQNDSEITAMLTNILFIGTDDVGFTEPYKKNVKAIIRESGFLRLPEPQNNRLPFLNGLLDCNTEELIPITPLNAHTWCLPYLYDAKADCPNIVEWLLQAVNNDYDTVMFILAWLAALLFGRADLQKFLHLIGSGGTGKGVLLRLATALVGKLNAASTTLKEMENNRFESARFYGKRLVTITDSDRYGGSLNMLKSMTGQDHIRLERKNVQQSGDYIFDGLIFMASNENLTSTDHSSGLERRRSTVTFDRRATDAEKQRWESKGGEAAVLHSEIPGLVNMLLGLSQDEISDLIRNPPSKSKKANLDAMTANNPLAEWLIGNCLPDATAWTQIGDKREIREQGCEIRFENSNDRLYPNYLTWCQRHNRTPQSLIRFKEILVDTLKTLGVDVIEKRRSGGKGISGIKLKKPWVWNSQRIWNKYLKKSGLM